jgi:hypothetical protein
MKKTWRWIGVVVIYIIGFFLSVLSSTNLFNGSTSLNTEEIDNNIKKMRLYSWFNKLYENEVHHRTFFVSLKVRKYFESSIRVSRLTNNEQEQKKFIRLLEQVAQARGENNV